MCYGDVLYDAGDAYVAFVEDYRQVKGYFAENYYPLTPCTTLSDLVAMQFGDEREGVILLYSRAGSKGAVTLPMNGLTTDGKYRLRTVKGEVVLSAQGGDLMTHGFALDVKERTAYIILYSEE